MRASALLLVSLIGCGFRPSGVSDSDPDATVIDAPDAGGDIDAPTDAPTDAAIDAIDASTCTPGCTGSILTTCSGGTPTTFDCPAGCGGASPACLIMQPSNGVSTADLATSTTAITVPSGRVLVWNSGTGEIVSWVHSGGVYSAPQTVRGPNAGIVDGVGFRVVPSPAAGAPGLGVWSVVSLTMPDGASWMDFRGPNAAVVLAAGPIVVHGWIDAAGGTNLDGTDCPTCPGAGGGTGATGGATATGCAPGGNGGGGAGADETGGAGGGMMTLGGNGGGGSIAGGVPAAVANCGPDTLIPLTGGGGGGRGFNGAPVSVGGGGGGGLQLTSLTSIEVSGAGALIDAAGEGGDGSGDTGNATQGGGGGGAGGGLLLEAPSINVTADAAITANGGGGGAGNANNSGAIGRSDSTRAAGGLSLAGDSTSLGAGGFGGISQSSLPTGGIGGGDGTGGGGGAAGRIRFNSVAGRPRNIAGTISPPPTTGTRPAQ